MTVHISLVASNGKIVQRYAGNFVDDDVDVIKSNSPDLLVVVTDKEVVDAYYDFSVNKFMHIPPLPDYDAVFDYDTKAYKRRLSIDELRQKVWDTAKSKRDLYEANGFMFEGNTYDSDTKSQARINAAAAAGLDVVWLTSDNREVELSAPKLVELQQALAQHIATAHDAAQAVRKQIYSSDDYATLDAILKSIEERQDD